MSKNGFTGIGLFLLSVLFLLGRMVLAEKLQYVPNEVIIKLEKETIHFPATNTKEVVEVEKIDFSDLKLKNLLIAQKGNSLQRVFSDAIPDDTLRILDDGSRVKLKDLSGYYTVSFDTLIDPKVMAESLLNCPGVIHAEPNWLYYPMVNPNDHYYQLGYQWHLDGTWGIRAPSAWDITTGSTSTKIAVVDGGVDYNHEDLAGKHYGGWDYGDDDPDPMDDMEEGPGDDQFGNHGTPVAGIIGAVTNNGIGVAGVDWNCRIMPIKVAGTHQFLLWEWNAMTEGDAAAGINHAVSDGAHVINMSFGNYYEWWNQIIVDNAVYSACYNAWQLGAVLVAAAGNEDTSDPLRPASYPFVIAVGVADYNGSEYSPPKGRGISKKEISCFWLISPFKERGITPIFIKLNSLIMEITLI